MSRGRPPQGYDWSDWQRIKSEMEGSGITPPCDGSAEEELASLRAVVRAFVDKHSWAHPMWKRQPEVAALFRAVGEDEND
jgi:hypothetical protein